MIGLSKQSWNVVRVCFIFPRGMHFGSALTSLVPALSLGNFEALNTTADWRWRLCASRRSMALLALFRRLCDCFGPETWCRLSKLRVDEANWGEDGFDELPLLTPRMFLRHLVRDCKQLPALTISFVLRLSELR